MELELVLELQLEFKHLEIRIWINTRSEEDIRLDIYFKRTRS